MGILWSTGVMILNVFIYCMFLLLWNPLKAIFLIVMEMLQMLFFCELVPEKKKKKVKPQFTVHSYDPQWRLNWTKVGLQNWPLNEEAHAVYSFKVVVEGDFPVSGPHINTQGMHTKQSTWNPWKHFIFSSSALRRLHSVLYWHHGSETSWIFICLVWAQVCSSTPICL